MVANHHSCGTTPRHSTRTSRIPSHTTPAANGTKQANAMAAVRVASEPGAVATASAAVSVERVSRAATTRLKKPMKNAGTTGVDSTSPNGSSSSAAMSTVNPQAMTVPAMNRGWRAKRRASRRVMTASWERVAPPTVVVVMAFPPVRRGWWRPERVPRA